jgi:hypothetical protein
MPIDKNKKRIVFLKHDDIVNLVHLARMHLDSGGAPTVLQKYPLSEEYAQSLKVSIEAMEEVLEEIWEKEDGSNGK